MRIEAEQAGAWVLVLNASRALSFPAVLALKLHRSLSPMTASVAAGESVLRAQCALVGFANALGLPSAVLGMEPNVRPEAGLADSGTLELDLADLLEVFGKAVRATASVSLLCVEDLEALSDEALRALIAALHRCVVRQLPICLVAAGPSSSRGRVGTLKPYAERLFEFHAIDAPDEVGSRVGPKGRSGGPTPIEQDPVKPMTAASLGQALGGLDEFDVQQDESAGKLFSIVRPARRPNREYPAFQAWPGIVGKPLQRVLAVLAGNETRASGPAAYGFFTSPTELLGGLTPIEALIGRLTSIRALEPDTREFLSAPSGERLEAVLQAAQADP